MQNPRIALALAGSLIVISGYQNCSSPKTSESQNNSSQSIYDSVDAFSKTLHPALKDNCAICHGTAQIPMFAVDDAEEALNTIQEFDLVDLKNPGNSRFVQKIGEGHNNFPQSIADLIQQAIEEWANGANTTELDDDVVSPAVQIVSPSNNATINGVFPVKVNATDDVAVARVLVRINGVVKAQSTTPPFTVNLDTKTLADGPYELRALALDTADNQGASTILNITVDNSTPIDLVAPTVSITAPAQGATVTGMVSITANAQDNVGIQNVGFYIDGGTLIGEDSTPPYSILWNSGTVVSGQHKIEAWTADTANNYASSSIVTVNVTGGKVINNPNAKYSWIYANILGPRCTTCHGANKASAGIRLHTYANVKDHVSPPNPNISPLYNSVKTGNMPRGSSALTATQIKAISDWIELGALNN